MCKKFLKMKILFSCGNAPGLPTGYGGQGLLALLGFKGHKTTVLAWNLTQPHFKPFIEYSTEDVLRINPQMQTIMDCRNAHEIDWSTIRWMCNPYTNYPAPIRKQDLNKMILDVHADLFVTLQDIFMFEPGPFACLSAVWMPLHFIPVEHPTVLALSDFDIQLPISGWGSMLLYPLQSQGESTWRHIQVLGHGRDIQVFRPIKDDEERLRIREKWNWPQDAFVCLLIASNSEESGRKAFDAQLQAFAEYAKINPKAWLHIHSEVVRAYDLGRLLETFGLFSSRYSWTDLNDARFRTHRDAIIVGENVSITPSMSLLNISEKEIAAVYRSVDVLLAATCSEGCGVPILEAQLCGTPVITTRATAMWEETHFGISVKPLQWIARMDFNSGWYLPNSKGICKALEDISSWTAEEKEKKFQNVLPLLIKEFSNESIVQKWQSVLELVKKKTYCLGKERLEFLSMIQEFARRSHVLSNIVKIFDESKKTLMDTYKKEQVLGELKLLL